MAAGEEGALVSSSMLCGNGPASMHIQAELTGISGLFLKKGNDMSWERDMRRGVRRHWRRECEADIIYQDALYKRVIFSDYILF